MRYVAAAVLLTCGLAVGAGDRVFAEEPPSLDAVKWMGPGTSYANPLRRIGGQGAGGEVIASPSPFGRGSG
jgi:hypothetical protein